MECKTIRKYLVLLQDCIAIKFVPIVQQRETTEDGKNLSRGGFYIQQSNSSQGPKLLNESLNKVTGLSSPDPSLKWFFLYKEFCDVNLGCYWNAALQETIENLEYKGTVIPSTILVGSPSRRHMSVLKNAWSQKILKSPSGYKIEFAGEIEELIADPIEKSHFIPLSDSICWTIHELTTNGQEASVDGILTELSSTFPGTVLPSKELLYQVLERLTKSQKVYQTSHGYFVVTPDTRRYIEHTDPIVIRQTPKQNMKDLFSEPVPAGFREIDGSILDFNCYDKKSESCDEDPSRANSPLKRSNSLRNNLKKYGNVSGCLPRRTFSMRSRKPPKKKDVMISPTITPTSKTHRVVFTQETKGIENQSSISKEDSVVDRRKKHKSFLTNLLSFRRSKKNNKTRCGKQCQIFKQETPNKFTISTQTSRSIENLPSNLQFLTISTTNQTPYSLGLSPLLGRKLEHGQDSDSGRYTESSSPQSERIEIHLRGNQKQNSGTLPVPLTQLKCTSPSSDAVTPTPSSMLSTPSQSHCSLTAEFVKHISPSSSRSSASPSTSFRDRNELFNNSYRRKHHHPNYYTLPHSSNLLTQKLPLSFKYPPRQFEKKQIYEKISDPKNHLPHENKVNSGNLSQTCYAEAKSLESNPIETGNPVSRTLVKSSHNSNLELELLLPLGKLISKVLTDFEQKSQKVDANENNNESNSNKNNDNKCNNERYYKNNEPTTISTTDTNVEAEIPVPTAGGKQPTINDVKSQTVNDLFTIKSFVKTTQQDVSSPFNSQKMALKTVFTGGNSDSRDFNIGHFGAKIKTTSSNPPLIGIETVSCNPFSSFYLQGVGAHCRESEII